jgi:hypothetical protein
MTTRQAARRLRKSPGHMVRQLARPASRHDVPSARIRPVAGDDLDRIARQLPCGVSVRHRLEGSPWRSPWGHRKDAAGVARCVSYPTPAGPSHGGWPSHGGGPMIKIQFDVPFRPKLAAWPIARKSEKRPDSRWIRAGFVLNSPKLAGGSKLGPLNSGEVVARPPGRAWLRGGRRGLPWRGRWLRGCVLVDLPRFG